MKKLLLIGLFSILAMPFTAYPWATGGYMPWVTQDGPGQIKYVKMAAQSQLCGAVFLVPKPGVDVALKAARVTHNIFGQETREETREDGKYNELSPLGLWAWYDMAGDGYGDHYRVYCYSIERGQFQNRYFPVDCDQVLEVEDKENMRLQARHNRGCVTGVGGPYAFKGPLFMDKRTLQSVKGRD